MGYDPNEAEQTVYEHNNLNVQNNAQIGQSIYKQTGNAASGGFAEDRQTQYENWEKDIIEKTKRKEDDESRFPTYNNHSILEIAGKALHCLVNISAKKYYNDTILVRTLHGSSDQRIIQDKLNLVPEYGKLSHLNRKDIRKVVDWLINKHYILETKGPYSVLYITNEDLYYKDHMTPGNMKSLIDLLNDRRCKKAREGKCR